MTYDVNSRVKDYHLLSCIKRNNSKSLITSTYKFSELHGITEGFYWLSAKSDMSRNVENIMILTIGVPPDITD
jgi:hypothetical protein